MCSVFGLDIFVASSSSLITVFTFSKMDQLIALCNDGLRYPLNLSSTDYPEYVLLFFFQQLNLNQHRLFSSEEKSELNFRDLDDDSESQLATIPPISSS